MASAARWPAAVSPARSAAAAGMPVSTAAMGSGTPMRPVEQTRTSSGGQPSAVAVTSHMRRAWARPGAPVAALAFPALRTTAAACPSVRLLRLTCTGAAATRLVVNTPAAVTGRRSAVATSARSGSPLALTPQATPAASNPVAVVTLTGGARRSARRSSRGARGRGWRPGGPARPRPCRGCRWRRRRGRSRCGRRSGR